MTYLDIAIPGAIGLLIAVWPHSMFIGSRVTPDAGRLKMIRAAGYALLGVAGLGAVVIALGG